MTTGSRRQAQRVCGPRSERDDEVLERLEKPVGTAKRCFRVKVVGSNPAGPTIRQINTSILNFLFWLKKKGYREDTLQVYCDVFKHFCKYVNLDDPEDVKAFIARKKVSEVRKQILVEKYARYCEFKQIPFAKPTYRAVKRLPFIHNEQEINALIAGCGKKTSVFLQLLKETGARAGEAFALKWIDIDFEKSVVCVNHPVLFRRCILATKLLVNKATLKESIIISGVFRSFSFEKAIIFLEHILKSVEFRKVIQ